MHTDARSAVAPVVILGGGLTGISTAFHLTSPWILFEKEDRLGGHARTDVVRGFHFDKTGHWLHLRDPYIKQLVAELLPGQMVPVERRARIFSHGALTRFPFQANLHGLPPTVVQECLLGFIQAWHRAQATATAAPGGPERRPANFEEFILDKMGEGIARHFMIPYNHKLWGVHPREITADWCTRFVPIPKLEDVVAGAVGANPPEMGYNVQFLYPEKGGIETLTRALVARLRGGSVHTRTSPELIDWRARRIQVGGEWQPYRALVASIPLPELVRRLVDPPAAVALAGEQLRCTPVRYLNVATRTPSRADFHWIYVPEEKYPFYRVGIYSNAVPSMAPDGLGSLYVELADRGPLSLDAILPDVAQALAAAGAINGPDDVLFAELRELKYAYVVFDHNYYAAVGALLPWLEAENIYPRGRYGSWTYNAMEDCLLAGRDVAEKLR
ncbi:MAG TPA: FAD-dependent oxidoreductase [Polyangia bacterium]|jgi:protoporphyrinogen oxidase|nr:FAD-dependent oxidoreductase [Polyangia bacterium]